MSTRVVPNFAVHFARLGERFFPLRLVIGLCAVVAAGFIIRPGVLFASHEVLGQTVSVLLVLAGVGLRAWAAASAGRHTRTASIEAPRLATGGPYAHVRNPIYLGSIILGLGMVGLLGDPRMLVLYGVTFFVLYLGIIPAEERFLRASFGEAYGRYFASVPRLLPRLSAWRGAVQQPLDWLAARSELFLLALLAVIYGGLRIAAWLRAV